jgi:hypothetical protein
MAGKRLLQLKLKIAQVRYHLKDREINCIAKKILQVTTKTSEKLLHNLAN